MKFYKFANKQKQILNIDSLKKHLLAVDDVTESWGATRDFYFSIVIMDGNGAYNISIHFDDEILAREELKNFIYFLENLN